MILAKVRIINYDSSIVIYSFIVLATVITIINYDHTVINIVNYDRKTFIVRPLAKEGHPSHPQILDLTGNV
jgi:hypothetical protein